ncbi:MAG: hypothetical protein V7742_22295 [Halioglobus sp.]
MELALLVVVALLFGTSIGIHSNTQKLAKITVETPRSGRAPMKRERRLVWLKQW